MKSVAYILLISLFASFAWNELNEPIFVGGIQVNEQDQERWVSTVSNAGFNTVEVTVYAKQGDWDSDNIWFDKEDTLIASEIRAAKKEGLNVVLILRVALDHAYKRNKFLWHGMIMPKDEQTMESWFNKYNAFVSFWAKFAERENVDVLGVGSEMNALTSTKQIDSLYSLEQFYLDDISAKNYNNRFLLFKDQIMQEDLWTRTNENYETLEEYLEDRRLIWKSWATQTCFSTTEPDIEKINRRNKQIEEKWREMVDITRKVFSGRLTYAANFDSYQKVGFWDAFDFMGINAYFPLRTIEQPASVEVFEESWTNIFQQIQLHQKNNGIEKPVLFTELGYTYKENSTVEPWNSDGFSVLGEEKEGLKLYIWKDQKENRGERVLAVKALAQAIKKTRFDLAGVLYWKLTTHDYHIKNEDFVLVVNDASTDSLQIELVKLKEGF